MRSMAELKLPIHSIFWSKKDSYLAQFFLIVMGVAVLTCSAQIRIPTIPVPITFQSCAVILIAMAYGARNGVYVVATYLVAGLCGLPVFENYTAGFSHVFGPTLGYLVGFIPAALLSGYLAQKGWARNMFSSFAAACLGATIIFSFGVSFLALSTGWANAITFGLLPFLITEPIKLAAISLLVPRMWRNQ